MATFAKSEKNEMKSGKKVTMQSSKGIFSDRRDQEEIEWLLQSVFWPFTALNQI